MLARRTTAAPWVLGLFACALLAASPARAEVRLGVGGDYVFNGTGMFELLMAVDGRVARQLSVGGRFGVLLLTTNPNTLGIPIDLDVRLTVARGRVYLEALGGPWILFGGAPVHGHFAFGFGLQNQSLSFGLEAGYITGLYDRVRGGAHLGARLALRI